MARYDDARNYVYDLPKVIFEDYGYYTTGEYSREVFEYKCRRKLSHDDTKGGQVRQNIYRFTGFGRW